MGSGTTAKNVSLTLLIWSLKSQHRSFSPFNDSGVMEWMKRGKASLVMQVTA